MLHSKRVGKMENYTRNECIFQVCNSEIETTELTVYQSTKTILVNLTSLNFKDTDRVIAEILKKISDTKTTLKTSEELNTLCWAVGSISTAVPENEEKKFLVCILRELLILCEKRQGKTTLETSGEDFEIHSELV